MRLTPLQLEQFDRDGYLFFPSLFSAEEIAVLTDEVPRALRAAPARERPREGQRRGADQLRGAHVQRALRAPGASPADDRSGRPGLRRAGLHAPVQDQRQDGLRRRRVAVAPGLRHLVQRRPDAGGPGDERRDLPRRGERVQRPADVHPRQPQARRARRRARHHRRPAIRCGPSITRRSRKLVARAAWWRPRARSAR